MDSLHKGFWWGALMFPIMPAWTNIWKNNREAGELKHLCTHLWTLERVFKFGFDKSNWTHLAKCSFSTIISHVPMYEISYDSRSENYRALEAFSYDWSVAIDVMDERNLLQYGSEMDFRKSFWTSVATFGHELLWNIKNKSHFVNISSIWHANELVRKLLLAVTHAPSSWTIIKNEIH